MAIPETIRSQIVEEDMRHAAKLFRLFRKHNPHLRILTVNADRPSLYWLRGH